MARSEGAEGPAQHLADAIAAAFARTEQPGEHLAVHAPKLAIEPRLQILRRHRRSLLLRLEHPYCSAVEDHVNRAPAVGLHRSFNLRIGIKRYRFKFQTARGQHLAFPRHGLSEFCKTTSSTREGAGKAGAQPAPIASRGK